MFARQNHVRRAIRTPLIQCQCRCAWASTRARPEPRTKQQQQQKQRSTAGEKGPDIYNAAGETALKLEQTGIWGHGRARVRKNMGAVKATDPRRVNITSEDLCQQIVKYMGSSLDRHRGCDLIDLNPGAGLWSRELHNLLSPRRHIMMDHDAEVYKPFLSDLLEKDNVELIPKSGIVWKNLYSMLDTRLPEQEVATGEALLRRNDTLLVTANLSMFPKRAMYSFDSVTTMVLYQFMSSIRSSSLFQRYGLVRMLLWVNDEDKWRFLPRSAARRHRTARETEAACDWVHEVAGHDPEMADRIGLRDEWLNLESMFQTRKRMYAAKRMIPSGRHSRGYDDARCHKNLRAKKLAGVNVPKLMRPFMYELNDLDEANGDDNYYGSDLAAAQVDADDAGAAIAHRHTYLKHRAKYTELDNREYLGLLKLRDQAFRLAEVGDPGLAAVDAEWNERVNNMKKNQRNEYMLLHDNYHMYRQSPPALLWDRREYDPLVVHPATDFFPNIPGALLDIQPKAMAAPFRDIGPGSTRVGDVSEAMLRVACNSTLAPMTQVMDSIWHGFGAEAARCPSLTDLTRGGSPLTGRGVITPRSMNEEQWTEVMQAWMDWPFRPSFAQLLGRLEDPEVTIDDDEQPVSKAGGMGTP